MQQPEVTLGHLTADANLMDSQYRFAKLGAAEGGFARAAANEETLGVLQEAVPQGQPGLIMNQGITLVRAGAAFAYKAKLKSDASGKAVAAAGADQIVAAIALEAATAADQLISVLLVQPSKQTLA